MRITLRIVGAGRKQDFEANKRFVRLGFPISQKVRQINFLVTRNYPEIKYLALVSEADCRLCQRSDAANTLNKLQRIFGKSSSVSLRILLCFVCLVVLQWFPPTGLILMMFGTSHLAGLLVHVFLLSLLVESLTKRVPLIFILVPLLAYASYYIFYFQEARQIAQISAGLKKKNPGKVIDFDPNAYSLVVSYPPKPAPRTEYQKSGDFISTYDVPVIYELDRYDPGKGYVSYRLVSNKQCADITEDVNAGIVTTFGATFNGTDVSNICILRFPEQPPHKIVEVALPDSPNEKLEFHGFDQQLLNIRIDGKTIASYKVTSLRKLPVFPFIEFGCALNSVAPKWQCFSNFIRIPEVIDGMPDQIDRTKFGDPVGAMLGIRMRTSEDLQKIKSSSTRHC